MDQNQEYGKGYFLIANPILPDPNFSRTVVLLCNHNEEGSFGLVMNRSADLSISEVFANYEELKAYKGKVFVGGPVSQGQVFYLCQSKEPLPGMEWVCEDIYLGMNWEALEEILGILNEPEKYMRFYLGYSGWGSGQLANEMEHRSWLTCLASNDFVFSDSTDQLWARVVRSMGSEYEYLVNAPKNPQWN